MSEIAQVDVTTAGPATPGRSLWADAVRRLSRNRIAMICFGIIVFYALLAIFAPIIFSDWQTKVDYDNLNKAPSWEHWLGTDTFGRDVLQKTLLGANVSMKVAFIVNMIAVPTGMILGAVAGYYGGKTDDFIVWIYTTLSCIPGLVLLLALKFAFLGQKLFEGTTFQMDLDGLAGMCIVLSITSWIGACRLVRAETMKLRELDYVLAARASGRGGFRDGRP